MKKAYAELTKQTAEKTADELATAIIEFDGVSIEGCYSILNGFAALSASDFDLRKYGRLLAVRIEELSGIASIEIED